jgi:streptogramin lyase
VNFDPFDSKLYEFKPNGSPSQIGSGAGRFDGVEVLPDGKIYYTSWVDSAVHRLQGKTDVKVIRHLTNPADIGYDTRRHRIAIPLAGPDAVQFWELRG